MTTENKKLKVLHFIWSASFGGIEKQVIDLCVAQNNAGFVKAGILLGTKKGSFMDDLTRLNIPHWYAGMKKGLEWNVNAYHSSLELMKQNDIIHIHTYNPLVLFAAIKSKKKIVYTIHGNFQFGRKITFYDIINNRLRKFFLNKYADLITFNSNWSRKIAEQRFGLEHKNKEVIYNGISFKDKIIQPITNEDHLIATVKKFVVGTTCRFNGSKRLDRLIDAFAIFCKDKQDTVLMMVGDGIEKNNLENRAVEKKILSKILFTGFQSNVKGYQQAMDVCVFPCANEAFGLVAVETLSLGKPTLLYDDAGGMLEITGDQLTEDIVDSVEKLAERISYYYNNKNITQENIIKKRIAIAENFSLEKMEATYLSVYLKLINYDKPLAFKL